MTPARSDFPRSDATAHAASPTSLAAHYERVRRFTLALAAPLTDEDCQVQSMPDASPTKWHLAHVTWFFETFILERFEPGFRAFEPMFRVLFNSYYQGVGERHPRPQRGLITSPTLEQVKRYRANVDERMAGVLAARPDDAGLLELVTLGLHHEQQHQELLLTDIKHALSFNPLHLPYAKHWPIGAVSPQPLSWHGHEGGMFQMGHVAALDGAFCFDNETPSHPTFVPPFELAARPVSNDEYMAFMDDGGYRRPELWLSMGWDWVQAAQREAPLYWRRDGQRWLAHSLQGLVEIDPHTPACHLSFFEAEAYARWAGARLPTEAEWELAARRLTKSTPLVGNFAERGAFHPVPAATRGDDEPVQMYGDVWEWTQSNYNPYPGYRPLPGAVCEYNVKFMCNQFVLRGGSCATPAGHVRATYRNFFPPDAQWQFSGVRLAR